MYYVYLNPENEEEEFRNPCEKIKENLINNGYTFLGWKINGKFYSEEHCIRVRMRQDPMYDIKEWLNSLKEKGIE